MNNNAPEHTIEWQSTPLYHFWQPRHWPLWLALAFMRIATLLPYAAQMAIGRWLGRRAASLVPERRDIASVNIGLCFPELSETELARLVKRHFESLGMSVFEIFQAWWFNDVQANRLVHINGLENLTGELEKGHGVILVSGHFVAAELSCRPLKPYAPGISALFREGKNPFMDEILRRSRGRTAHRLISKDDARLMIRTLRQRKVVWYASDQSFHGKDSALIPFFGVPAMTSLALSGIARLGRARVVPYFPRRLDNDRGYAVDILPALDNFPSDDPGQDALRIHHLLEERIRMAPEQYYWVHRRFKSRPAELDDPYRAKDA